MFTFIEEIKRISELGKSIDFLEHILAVAVVDAVRSLTNSEVESF